jgi:hypothetical protein
LSQWAYETSFSWREDFAALGFVVGDGDIETVRASLIQHFYRGRCADVRLLGPCLTLTGCCLRRERSGAGSAV